MPLVEYEEQRLYMALSAGQDEALLGDLLSATTRVFEKSVGRELCPYGKAQLGRAEVIDPIAGSRKLWLDYPIQQVTAIALGRDVNAPDETLSPTDAARVVWRVGQRIITRTDGGVWRSGYYGDRTGGAQWRGASPRWVKVTYDTQADLPRDVKLAVMQVTATIWRTKGTGVIKSWSLGDESQTIEIAAAQDLSWVAAIRENSRGVVF